MPCLSVIEGRDRKANPDTSDKPRPTAVSTAKHRIFARFLEAVAPPRRAVAAACMILYREAISIGGEDVD
jgi:hypothetical protein